MSANGTGLKTPVVLIVFNRPSLTRAVFERIAQARPERLLVIADGPRADRTGEQQLCAEVRTLVRQVDWPCQVQENFAAENMGCRRRVISGLHWAFEQVEEAIILEDDILPDPSFFPYCAEMLARFREDARIAMITGFNIGADRQRTQYSYYFSELTHIWGWATWRRAWKHYDEDLSSWPELRRSRRLRDVLGTRSAERYWRPILDGMHRGTGPNTWDYQWMYTNFVHGSLAIAPQVNLVQNLGFGGDATHSTDPEGAPRVSVRSLGFPLRHPPAMAASRRLDALDQRLSEWHRPSVPVRVVRKAARVLQGQR